MTAREYLVYRSNDGWAWRYPEGRTPGQLTETHRIDWVESVCHPGNFYITDDVTGRITLDPNFTVSFETFEEDA